MTDKWFSSHKWLLLAIACLVYSCEPPRQGVENKVDPTQSIPISAGVEHFSNPDGQSSTWVTFYVKQKFAEPLPEAIEKVTVTANGKTLPLSKSNFTYFPNRRLFWASIPGAPEIGDYNITVTSQTGSGIVWKKSDRSGSGRRPFRLTVCAIELTTPWSHDT